MRTIATLLLLSFVLASPAVVHAEDNPWRSLDRPTHRDLNKLCFIDSMTGWVVGDSGTILKTTTGGATWVSQSSGVTAKLIDIFMLNHRLGWALGQQYPTDTTNWIGTRFLHTTNGGANWTLRDFHDTIYFCVTFLDSSVGFMGNQLGQIARSTDGGATWTAMVIEPGEFSRLAVRRIKFVSPQTGFAVGGRMDIAGVVWRTTDGGSHWRASRVGEWPDVGTEPFYDIYCADSNRLLCVGGDFDFGASVGMSTNGGTNWLYINPRIWGETRALAFRTPREGWAPLGFTGTYMVTRDSGTTWTDQYTDDSSAVYDVTFTDSLTGYMIGEEGLVLKYTTPPTSVRPPAGVEQPGAFALLDNYPNPFNPGTSVEFRVPPEGVLRTSSELVTLRVYDVLGREVATLVNDVLQQGTYAAQWDATGFPGGVYFCRMTSGRFSATRKMLLLR